MQFRALGPSPSPSPRPLPLPLCPHAVYNKCCTCTFLAYTNYSPAHQPSSSFGTLAFRKYGLSGRLTILPPYTVTHSIYQVLYYNLPSGLPSSTLLPFLFSYLLTKARAGLLVQSPPGRLVPLVHAVINALQSWLHLVFAMVAPSSEYHTLWESEHGSTMHDA